MEVILKFILQSKPVYPGKILKLKNNQDAYPNHISKILKKQISIVKQLYSNKDVKKNKEVK